VSSALLRFPQLRLAGPLLQCPPFPGVAAGHPGLPPVPRSVVPAAAPPGAQQSWPGWRRCPEGARRRGRPADGPPVSFLL